MRVAQKKRQEAKLVMLRFHWERPEGGAVGDRVRAARLRWFGDVAEEGQ